MEIEAETSRKSEDGSLLFNQEEKTVEGVPLIYAIAVNHRDHRLKQFPSRRKLEIAYARKTLTRALIKLCHDLCCF